MVLEQTVIVLINQYNEQYYKDKGYIFGKRGEKIEVKTEDLSPGSGIKIHCQCNYCGRIIEKAYRRYLQTCDDICCDSCKEKKVLKNTIEKYGVRSTLRLPEIEGKVKATNLEKLGVEMPLQSPIVREKCKETMRKRYGEAYTLQSKELREKVNFTLLTQGKSIVYTSAQQKTLNEYIGGELNYPIGPYYIDIFLKEQNVCVEYDGRGHDLSVRTGKITPQEFVHKEKNRIEFLLQRGYKLLKLKSKTDKLPNFEKLKEIIENCLLELKVSNFYSYNFDDDSESFEY